MLCLIIGTPQCNNGWFFAIYIQIMALLGWFLKNCQYDYFHFFFRASIHHKDQFKPKSRDRCRLVSFSGKWTGVCRRGSCAACTITRYESLLQKGLQWINGWNGKFEKLRGILIITRIVIWESLFHLHYELRKDDVDRNSDVWCAAHGPVSRFSQPFAFFAERNVY